MQWERARTDEQKEQRISEIVAATERLYEKYGFDEITFVLIAEEANFTRSNLYKYFTTKEEIFLEFMQNDINIYAGNLVKEFSKNKNYTIDQFVKTWVKVLVKNKRLLNLFGILFSSLEKNCSFEALTEFKLATKEDLSLIVEMLCTVFPGLEEEKAKEFFYLQFSLAVGLFQMTNHSKLQKKVLEQPELKDFNIDFETFYKRSIEHLIKGVLGS